MLKWFFVLLLMTLLSVFGDGRQTDLPAEEQQTEATLDDEEYYTVEDLLPAPLDDTPEQLLERTAYTASYNEATRLPNWVAWLLTADHANGTLKRPGRAYHEDQEVPLPRATDADYRGSGYDRGHMCPAGDNKWDAEAMYETFLMTNMCPQNARLNSGDWNEIEMACRRWARKYGEVFIVCGPILMNRQHATIGKNRVVVPEAFFKVVLCLNGEPKGIGFVCRNTDGNRPKDLYVNTIAQVERITGLRFFQNLDLEVAEQVKSVADLDAW